MTSIRYEPLLEIGILVVKNNLYAFLYEELEPYRATGTANIIDKKHHIALYSPVPTLGNIRCRDITNINHIQSNIQDFVTNAGKNISNPYIILLLNDCRLS